MQRYIRFILRRHKLVLGVLILITSGFALMISRGVISSSLGTMFFGEDPRWEPYLERLAEFSNDNLFIYAWPDDTLLTVPDNERLRNLVEELESLPMAARVHSLLDAAWMEGNEGNLIIHNYIEEADAQPNRVEELRTRLRADPDLAGLLVSRDGRHQALVIEPSPNDEIKGEELPILREQIIAVFGKYGIAREKLHSSGMNAVMADVMEETYHNLTSLLPWSVLLLFILGWILFRRLWPIVITLFLSGIADIWTVGLSVIMDKEVNLFISIAPVIILVVATADVIHLCSAYLIELGNGKSKNDAIIDSASEVGIPCVLTSATTFLGFASMSFVPTPVFRQIGIVLGAGVAFALLLAITLTPILFHLLPQPKPLRTGVAGQMQDVLDHLLAAIRSLVIRYPRRVLMVFALLFVLTGYGALKVHIDTDMAARFRPGHPANTSAEFFRAQFDGTNTIDLYLGSAGKDSALQPDRLVRIAKLQDAIEAWPEVENTSALPDLIAPVHRALTDGTLDGYPLADSAYTHAQYLLLLSLGEIDAASMFLNGDRDLQKLNVRLKTGRAREASLIGDRAAVEARRILDPADRVEPLGIQYLLGSFLDTLVQGQIIGLLFAIVTIALMMMVGTGSIRIGLLSMIPNILPLLVFGTAMTLVWERIDSDMIMLAMIAIGIGVDDTIHFLLRYRFESQRAASVEEALEKTYNFAGRAIIITSLILVAGFGIDMISQYLTFWAMGVFLPLTLFVALIADLVMLPAMIEVGWIRFRRKE